MFWVAEGTTCSGKGPMNLCQSLWFHGPAGELSLCTPVIQATPLDPSTGVPVLRFQKVRLSDHKVLHYWQKVRVHVAWICSMEGNEEFNYLTLQEKVLCRLTTRADLELKCAANSRFVTD